MSAPRLRSLDVFRGLTVAAMVLVNSPGSDEIYAPFRHSVWNGWTPTDLVFPFFLVILGVSAAFSDASRRARGATAAETARRALLRAGGLMLLGLIENWFIYRSHGVVRLPGVLQRIALCSLGVEALLPLGARAQAAACAALLLGYWGLLGSDVSVAGNLSYALDRRLLGPHLLDDRWGDPEGLLSTLPALATCLLGVLAGRRLLERGAALARRLGEAGLALAAAGSLWSLAFPLNKHIWTSSFALFAGGLALAALALCLRAVEGRPAAWAAPFEAAGRRALSMYVFAGAAYGIAEYLDWKRPTNGLLEAVMSQRAASLVWASAFTAAVLLVAQGLDRRQQGRLSRRPEAEQDTRSR